MRYVKYFMAQLKRTIRLAVGVFPTAMLLFACLGAACYSFYQLGPLSDGQKKYQIGIVGKVDDTYLGFGVAAIQTMDSTRFMADFIPMTEEEAQKAFQSGELVTYVRIPDEFLESVVYGRNDVPLGYVTSESQKGLESYLMEELSVCVSKLVTSSQASIYSMQRAARELGEREHLGKWTDELNLQMIAYVLGRTGLAELETLGLSIGLSVIPYYFCTILLLFCFMFGISSSSLFLRRNEDLGRWMKLRGIGPCAQVLCEYVCYLALTYVCVSVPVGITWLITDHFSFLGTKVWLDEILWALLPVTILACAMHFAIYEVVRNPVGSLLLQFLGVLGMGYVSGYLYPASFFPEGIAKVGSVLPTGIALRSFSGDGFHLDANGAALGVMAYTLIFLTISVLMRRWMILRENG